ncbi:hypothetical protein TOK_4989 [Pseudonocardia sp. N23]|nr:hypothetical protein TOK_4989 [Pseudonocardia sp. N23]
MGLPARGRRPGIGRRGTTPLAACPPETGGRVASRSTAVTGRTRPVLLRAPARRDRERTRFFRRLPGDGRIDAIGPTRAGRACTARVARGRHPLARAPAGARGGGTLGQRASAWWRAAMVRLGLHSPHGVKPSSTASRTGSGINACPSREGHSVTWKRGCSSTTTTSSSRFATCPATRASGVSSGGSAGGTDRAAPLPEAAAVVVVASAALPGSWAELPGAWAELPGAWAELPGAWAGAPEPNDVAPCAASSAAPAP